MVSIKTRVGPKGQIVIPKVFRDEYNISPGDQVVLREEGKVIVVEKPKEDIVKKLEEYAKKIRFRGKIDVHAIEEEYEERWKRAQRST